MLSILRFFFLWIGFAYAVDAVYTTPTEVARQRKISPERVLMKNLTSSVYNFEKLRQEDFLYVDKTEYIWNLITPAGRSYFLSRPRRFGKILDTIHLESNL